MEWYNYIFGFLAGAFWANFVPHFVHGISGNSFPTPFARLGIKEVSSPVVNVLWGLFNLIAGYLLFRIAKISEDDYLSLVTFFAGFAFLGISNSLIFTKRGK